MLGLLFGLASALVLEKPFELTGWTPKGDYKTGNDVFMLSSKEATTASLWSQEPVPYKEWTAEIHLRTFAGTGDAGNSGWGIFYTSNPLSDGALHGSSEYYDGLAVTLDSMGWDDQNLYPNEPKGAIRGHLSDGTEPFSSSPADQAFSLCRIPYRSTQAPVKLRIGYGRGVFAVEVNGQKCFTSDRIVLPSGYFGISTNTGYSGDSFALEKVAVSQGLNPELEKYFEASQLEAPIEQVYALGQGSRASPGEGGAAIGSSSGSGAPKEIDLSPLVSAVSDLGNRLDNIQSQFDNSHNNLREAIALGAGSASDNTGGQHLDKVLELVEAIHKIGARVENLEGSSQRQLEAANQKIDGLHSKIDQLHTKLDLHSKQIPESVGSMVASPQVNVWGPVAALLVGQAVVYIGYMSYIARASKHQKLL